MTTFATVDVETTGLGTNAQVVEVAVVGTTSTQTFLVKPTVPIEPGARAVHHIRDDELSLAPTMQKLLMRNPTLFNADVLVGHNIEFDKRMLLQSGVPKTRLPSKTVCTIRCALHMFSDAPAFSNQTLRYWLGMDVTLPPSHRALSDALVTNSILKKMLTLASVEELIELTQTPALLHTVRFGKHRGTLWRDLDTSYLAWVLGREFGADELFTAQYWLNERSGPPRGSGG